MGFKCGRIGVQLIVEEVIRSGLINKLKEINLQGNDTKTYDYKKILSQYNISIDA